MTQLTFVHPTLIEYCNPDSVFSQVNGETFIMDENNMYLIRPSHINWYYLCKILDSQEYALKFLTYLGELLIKNHNDKNFPCIFKSFKLGYYDSIILGDLFIRI